MASQVGYIGIRPRQLSLLHRGSRVVCASENNARTGTDKREAHLVWGVGSVTVMVLFGMTQGLAYFLHAAC